MPISAWRPFNAFRRGILGKIAMRVARPCFGHVYQPLESPDRRRDYLLYDQTGLATGICEPLLIENDRETHDAKREKWDN